MNIRIVVADDRAVVRAGVIAIINCESDLEVVGEAADAEQALVHVKNHAPEVLIMCFSVADCQLIRSVKDAHAETKVIVLALDEQCADLESCLSAGGSGFLMRSASPGELIASIRTVQSGRSYIDASTPNDNRATNGRPDSFESLSARERQVLELVALGYTHREIAEQISVSIKTVETYRGRISDKLGVRSRAQLVRYALDAGLMNADAPRPPVSG